MAKDLPGRIQWVASVAALLILGGNTSSASSSSQGRWNCTPRRSSARTTVRYASPALWQLSRWRVGRRHDGPGIRPNTIAWSMSAR